MNNEDKEHQPPLGENHPNQDELARRAYELYQARGGEPGDALEDPLEAEREVKETARLSIAATEKDWE